MLNNLKSHQKGNYTCEAENKKGTTSKDVTLGVFKNPSAKIKTETTEIIENDQVSLECQVANTDDNPTVQWIDQDGKVLASVSSLWTYRITLLIP